MTTYYIKYESRVRKFMAVWETYADATYERCVYDDMGDDGPEFYTDFVPWDALDDEDFLSFSESHDITVMTREEFEQLVFINAI